LRDVTLSDVATIALTNANVTLTEAQYLAPFLLLTGTLTANVQIIAPNKRREWVVINNTSGAFTVTVKTSAGSGVVAAQGIISKVMGDGTNVTSVSVPQASETFRGGAEIATQAEVEAGSDDARIVTPSKLRFGFAVLLASNGHIAFPAWMGGLIIQWGQTGGNIASNSNQTITYSLTYPNGTLQAFATLLTSAPSATPVSFGTNLLSNSQLQIYNWSSVAASCRWLSIGR